ncbi:MAG TPA: hypothetical protein V6C85_29565 [Allocoleopsis sp.]
MRQYLPTFYDWLSHVVIAWPSPTLSKLTTAAVAALGLGVLARSSWDDEI